jgi:hypothetical protein
LASLISGNLAPLATSVSLEGALFDNGDARQRVVRAQIATAQAEIAWLQAQARGEIAILDATVELAGARAALSAARTGHSAAEAELIRSKARKAAGEVDGGNNISLHCRNNFRLLRCCTLQFICDEIAIFTSGGALDAALYDIVFAVCKRAAEVFSAKRLCFIVDELSPDDTL